LEPGAAENRNDDILDLPWMTENDALDTLTKNSFQLRQDDQSSGQTRALAYFQIQVLDKYRKHKYCIVDDANPFSCSISFLDIDGALVVSSASFVIHHGYLVVMPLEQLARIPPKENQHWNMYRVMDDARELR
jgi:hypothetical protein